MRKTKQNPQRSAIDLLRVISEGETGYLKDWQQINQAIKIGNIKTKQNKQQIGPILQLRKQSKVSDCQYMNRKTMQSLRHRKSGSHGPRKIKQVKVQTHVTTGSRIEEGGRYGDIERQEQKIMRQMLVRRRNRSPGETRTKSMNYLSKCKEQLQKKCKPAPVYAVKYIEKMRRMSLPWLKHMPKSSTNLQPDNEAPTNQQQNARRLSQIIRTKMKKKRSLKLNSQYEYSEQQRKVQHTTHNPEFVNLLTQINAELRGQKQDRNTESNNKDLKLLKSWLDSNRSRKKRSMTSLLREHFENKYLQKKQQKQKIMNQKINLSSTRFIEPSK